MRLICTTPSSFNNNSPALRYFWFDVPLSLKSSIRFLRNSRKVKFTTEGTEALRATRSSDFLVKALFFYLKRFSQCKRVASRCPLWCIALFLNVIHLNVDFLRLCCHFELREITKSKNNVSNFRIGCSYNFKFGLLTNTITKVLK